MDIQCSESKFEPVTTVEDTETVIVKNESIIELPSDSEEKSEQITTFINISDNECKDQTAEHTDIKEKLNCHDNENCKEEESKNTDYNGEGKVAIFETCYVKEEVCDYEQYLLPENLKTDTEDIGETFRENQHEEVVNIKSEIMDNKSIIFESQFIGSSQPGCSNSNEYEKTVISGDGKCNTSVLEKHFQCNECHKIYSSFRYLCRHIDNVHNPVQKYECNECFKIFFDVCNLHQHIDDMHRKIKKYECNECLKMFSSLRHLKIHIGRVHKRLKEYKCNICQKMFSALPNLQRHVDSVHHKIKSFECNVCHKMFARLADLKLHDNDVHKGIKEFSCNNCDKMFSRLSSLKKHYNSVHIGIRNYKCEMCEKMFKNSQHLKEHINSIHDKLKKYKCNICHKMYTSSRGLRSHYEVHLQAKDYNCITVTKSS